MSSYKSDQIESEVYNNKVKINHWVGSMMEHKKIYYSAELKKYQIEMMLANWNNSNRLRWSVRSCEIASPVHREQRKRERTALWNPDETWDIIRATGGEEGEEKRQK